MGKTEEMGNNKHQGVDRLPMGELPNRVQNGSDRRTFTIAVPHHVPLTKRKREKYMIQDTVTHKKTESFL